jgi:diguanylate cyclase (GGDEF)-like protein/PAS domain S-box-containing protein
MERETMTPSEARISSGAAGAFAANIGHALLESSLAAVIGLDEDWQIVAFSPAAEEMFGRPREQAVGLALSDLIISPRLRALRRGAGARPASRSSLMGRSEQTAVRADGSHFPVEMLTILAGHGDGAQLVCLLRDITDRRLSEYRLAASEALLAEAEELAGAGSFEGDLHSGSVVWSSGIYRILGLDPGRRPPSLHEAVDLLHPDDRPVVRSNFERIIQQRQPTFAEQVRLTGPDGTERTVELRGKVVFDDFGEAERLVGTARDMTDERDARRNRDLLSYVVESSDDAIITKDSRGIITSWNRGAERLYGYSAEEAIGRPVSLIVPPGGEEEQAQMTRQVFSGESVHQMETTRLRRDGTDVAVSLSISPVRDDHGKIVSAAVIARDVTERRRYEARLRALAEHDHLTGLLNRRRFEAELRRELSRAGRSGECGAVVSVDLDGFKAINDSVGHAAGDEVLRTVGNVLASGSRESDLVARLGGDEFALLLPGSDRHQARAAAQHLLDALHSCRPEVDGTPFPVTASIGVALFSADSARWDELLINADLAMYEAKRQGRDRIVVFSSEQAQTARANAKLSWAQRIRQALDDDGLVLHWQAIVDLGTNRPSHGELLLRMRSGDRLLPPGEFLGAAERLGLIHAIDRWVVRQAIELLARGEAPAGLPLSVNLSGESVAGDPDLLRLIHTELDGAHVDPSKLIFEVTETAAIANILEAREFALGVRRLGCSLALDDFGTGFGSFYHLKHLPVDFLKIDREFVHNLPQSRVDQRLVRSIVEVAQALKIRTVAESVGDDATIRLLRRLGVDFIQGFHVGHPQPVG